MTDEALKAFGEDCVAEAAPDIVKAATVDLKVENSGLKATEDALRAQRDDALVQRDDAKKEAKTLTIIGTVLSWVGGLLLAADFIFGWWRFGG